MNKYLVVLLRKFFLLFISLFLLSELQTASAQSGNNSSFIGQSVPVTMAAGTTYAVSLTFVNNGNTDWSSSSNYLLGSSNPRDNSTWGISRVALAGTIPRTGQAVFNFNITAPKTLGTYNFQWQMLREGVEWFGVSSTNIVVSVVAPSNGAQFVSQDVPGVMSIGQSYTSSVTFKNTGNTGWTTGTAYGLGSQKPENNVVWGGNRNYPTGFVAPGQQSTFMMTITAPTTQGIYPFQWRVLQEYVEWFGELTPLMNIVVIDPASKTILQQALAGSSYSSSSCDTNGDGRPDYLVKEKAKTIMLPIDDDLLIPIVIPATRPARVFLSSSNTDYLIVEDSDGSLQKNSCWVALVTSTNPSTPIGGGGVGSGGNNPGGGNTGSTGDTPSTGGTITSVIEKYEYNVLGRLIKVMKNDAVKSQYQYDKAGNRKQVNE